MHGLVAIFLSAIICQFHLSVVLLSGLLASQKHGGVRLHVLYWFYEKKSKYSITYPRIKDTIPQTNTKCILENGCLEDFILFFLGQMDSFQRRCLLVLQNVITTLPTFWPSKAPLYHCTARKPWSIIVEAIEGCGMGGKVPIKKVALRIYPPENQYGNGTSPFLIGDTSSISFLRVSC